MGVGDHERRLLTQCPDYVFFCLYLDFVDPTVKRSDDDANFQKVSLALFYEKKQS
jgi:hypothetical protein